MIPKPLLAQPGFEGHAEMMIERGTLVLRKPAKTPRSGWAEAAKQVAATGNDELVLGEFANEEDVELGW